MKKSGKLACHVVNANNRYWFLADKPNIARNYSVIWKDLWWKADSYRHLKHREDVQYRCFKYGYDMKSVAARHCAIIGKQLLISNYRNRVRWAVLGLSQDRVCIDSFENFSVKSLKRLQSNDTKFNPPLFSLVNTIKGENSSIFAFF
jgi:hypothetical protein